MQALLRHKLKLCNSTFNSLFRLSSSSYFHSYTSPLNSSLPSSTSVSAHSTATNSFTTPWSTIQRRGNRVHASDIRVGNTIGKQGRIYEVLKVEHSHEGRGKATIKVELRDLLQGTKVSQRMGPDEDVEKAYLQEKNFMYMCTDQDGTVVLMDTDTLDQIEVSKDLFGKNGSYIRDEMKVKVQFYEDKPLSASVPKRVICTVKEVIAATPRNKKVILDHGPTIEVPPHIVAGDAILVNTEDDCYIESQLFSGVQ
ncbi:elongation factor P (EF-P) family protein [Trifolium repens]|nr:elongation factor P (EF-P) family protein [Trifolium repens]